MPGCPKLRAVWRSLRREPHRRGACYWFCRREDGLAAKFEHTGSDAVVESGRVAQLDEGQMLSILDGDDDKTKCRPAPSLDACLRSSAGASHRPPGSWLESRHGIRWTKAVINFVRSLSRQSHARPELVVPQGVQRDLASHDRERQRDEHPARAFVIQSDGNAPAELHHYGN